MWSSVKTFSHLGDLDYIELYTITTVSTVSFYVAEDGATFYVAENGTDFYVTEH